MSRTKMLKLKSKTVYFADIEVWKALEEHANAVGDSVSNIIVEAVREYLARR